MNLREFLISTSHLDALEQAIKEEPELVNQQDELGRTLLHHLVDACRTLPYLGIMRALSILYVAKADISIVDHVGENPIHRAIQNIDAQFVSEFLVIKYITIADEQDYDYECATNLAGETYDSLFDQNRDNDYFFSRGLPHPLEEKCDASERATATVISFVCQEITDEKIGVFNEGLRNLPLDMQLKVLAYIKERFANADAEPDTTLDALIAELDEYHICGSLEQAIQNLNLTNQMYYPEEIPKMRRHIVLTLDEYITNLKTNANATTTHDGSAQDAEKPTQTKSEFEKYPYLLPNREVQAPSTASVLVSADALPTPN